MLFEADHLESIEFVDDELSIALLHFQKLEQPYNQECSFCADLSKTQAPSLAIPKDRLLIHQQGFDRELSYL